MKLYALCWQDVTEPWGWAPALDPVFNLPQVFFWDVIKAGETLVAYLAENPSATDRGAGWSVQEYDVPDPPLQFARVFTETPEPYPDPRVVKTAHVAPHRRTEFRCKGCGLTSRVSRPDHLHGGASMWQAIPVEG